MGYTKIFWPDSQYLHNLDEEDMSDYCIEWGDNMSAFIPDEYIDEVCEKTGMPKP